ncbi:MAG: plasmid mobilization relaxosome protein MobC [Bacteroidales bacterium]|nr:plasmid mobilization relaxosome protein MobC [Bacteroidales bacterium]
MRTNKTKMISLRLTEAQYSKLHALLELSGYKSRTRFIIEAVLGKGGRLVSIHASDDALLKARKQLLMLYKEMAKEGANLNQITKSINAIRKKVGNKYVNWKKLSDDITMAGHVAEKLTWRSRDVHNIAVGIECDYVPSEEEADEEEEEQ